MHVITIKWWMIKLAKTMSLCTIFKEINHRNVHCFTPMVKGTTKPLWCNNTKCIIPPASLLCQTLSSISGKAPHISWHILGIYRLHLSFRRNHERCFNLSIISNSFHCSLEEAVVACLSWLESQWSDIDDGSVHAFMKPHNITIWWKPEITFITSIVVLYIQLKSTMHDLLMFH